MGRFKIRVADRVFDVTHRFAAVADCCKEYRVSEAEPADAEILLTEEAVAFEKRRSREIAALEGRAPVSYGDDLYELSAANRLVSQELLRFDTLLMHGSAVAIDGCAYIFTAKSGTGKSTHVSFWKELGGVGRVVIVNDDKPFLRITGEQVLVYGSPWCGKEGRNTNCCVPLSAVCILQRGEQNRIRELSFVEALPMLLSQIYRPQDGRLLAKTMELLEELSGKLRFARLECLPEPEAALTAYRFLTGNQEDVRWIP